MVKTPLNGRPIALRDTPAAANSLANRSWTNAIEKLGSRQTALKERRAAERTSDRLPAVKTPLKSRPIALRQTPAAAKPLANSSPAWTKAVEKLRSRQTLLERAATAGTTDTAGTQPDAGRSAA